MQVVSVEYIDKKIFDRRADGSMFMRDSGFNIMFGKLSRTGTGRTLYNEPCDIMVFNNTYDAEQFKRSNRTYAGIEDIAVQYIQQVQQPDELLDWGNHVIAAIDIENEFDPSKPYKRADYSGRILSIGIAIMQGGSTEIKRFQLGYHAASELGEINAAYIQCQSEKDLLMQMANVLHKNGATIITGWNTTNHDIPYIMEKINVHGLPMILSPFFNATVGKLHTVDKEGLLSKLAGITHIDLLEAYRKYSFENLPNFSLNSVAEYELDAQKVEYHEEYDNLMVLYEKNPTLFYNYNIQDSVLVLQIEQKRKFLQLAATISFLGGMPLSNWESLMRFWDAYIARLAYNRDKKLVPPRRSVGHAEIKGAFVKDTIVGIHRAVVVFDAESLYPTCMQIGNISADKFIGVNVDADELAKYKSVYIAPNGAAFDTTEQGIISVAVAQVFGLRKQTKAGMKLLEKEREQMISNGYDTTSITNQIATSNIYQLAYKTAINGLYGLHGSEFFRYYHPAIAEAITSTGVLINQHFMARINHWIEHGDAEFDLTQLRNKHYDEAYINGLRNIIAGDTDSSMITLAKRVRDDLSGDRLIDAMSVVSDELTANFKAWASEIAECTNMMPGSVDKLNYKREKFAVIGLFRAKKNYAMRVYDNEGVRYATPELYVKGLESVKVSTPGWAQDALERVYESILDGVNPKPIVDKVRAWHENCDIMDVSKTQRVSNVDYSHGHVSTGAQAYNKMAAEFNAKPITSGSLVQWFYLTEPNPVRNNTIAIPTTEPSKQILNIIAPYIDRKLMFEKSIGEAAQSVAVLGNYDISNKRTMANFLIKKKV